MSNEYINLTIFNEGRNLQYLYIRIVIKKDILKKNTINSMILHTQNPEVTITEIIVELPIPPLSEGYNANANYSLSANLIILEID